jgi:hypothetical protein
METNGCFDGPGLRPCFTWVLVGLGWSELDRKMVETAGIEPASASPLQTVLHT